MCRSAKIRPMLNGTDRVLKLNHIPPSNSISLSRGWWQTISAFYCIHCLMPIGCHFRDCKALLVTSLTHVCGAITSVQTFTFIFICLLSRRSRQRERLYATGVSICSSVCLSVCRQIAKTQFSQNLSNLELWSLLTTNRKSYMGF